MKVLVVAPSLWNTAPGSRFRIEQWMPLMKRDGFEFTYAAFEDEQLHRVIYADGRYGAKAWHTLRAVGRRLALLRDLKEFDLVFLYEEASKVGPAVIERMMQRSGIPIVFDFCDPIYLGYKSLKNKYLSYLKCPSKTDAICRLSTLIIVGNPDLEQYARQFNDRVAIVPITIDVEEYQASDRSRWTGTPVIGWSGSHSTVRHLDTAREALQQARRRAAFTLRILGTPQYELPGVEVEPEDWRPDLEKPHFQSVDIGIMPLPGDEWTRLRSHLKVRQYMASAVPCVASPVGVITELIQDGVNGFLASSAEEWTEKLGLLLSNADLRRRMGARARQTIVDGYSGQHWAPRVGAMLRSVAQQQAALAAGR